MVRTHAKGKTSGRWRNKETSSNSSNCNGYSRVRLSSRAIGHQPLGVSGANWKEEDILKWAGGINRGKILDQLIEETRQELAHHVKQVEKLTERLQGLETLDRQLMQKTEE